MAKINKHKTTLNIKANSKIVGIQKKPARNRSRRRGSLKKKKRDPTGVVYISHIPHGFYEEQIEAYFSQFGKVTGVNVPRSKTGRAKGYAFIEYRYPEIAQIAADTMNNYLMLNRLLKAKYIPPENQKPHLFRKVKEARENNKTLADKTELAIKHARKLKNRVLKPPREANKIRRLLKKKDLLNKRIKESGLSSDFEVEEANYQSLLLKSKEGGALRQKNNNNKESMSDKGEETDTDTEGDIADMSDVLSFSDNDSSLQSDDLISEDSEDIQSESEEDKNKSISKSLAAAREILKSAKRKKPDIPSEVQSPRLTKTTNNTSSGLRTRKSLSNKNASSFIEKTPPLIEKSKAALQTPTGRKSNVIPIDMKVESNDKNILVSTPNRIKTPKGGKISVKQTPSEIISSQASPTKQASSKKTNKTR